MHRRTIASFIFLTVLAACVATPKSTLAHKQGTPTKHDQQLLVEFNTALDKAKKALEDRPYHRNPDIYYFSHLNSKGAASFDDSELGKTLKAKAMFYTAKKLQLLRSYPIAIDQFSQAIVLGLKNTEIYLYRGECFSELGKQTNNQFAYDLAIADYTEAIKHNRESVDSYFARAVAKWRKADIAPTLRTHPFDSKELLTSANVDFNQCLRLEPNSAKTLYYRASLYRRLSRLDQTTSGKYLTLEESDLSKLVDLKGKDPKRYYFQARFWLDQAYMHRRAEEEQKMKQGSIKSLKLISKNIELESSFSLSSYLMRHQIYWLLKDQENQFKDITAIISNAPGLSIGYQLKGYFHKTNKQIQDAITAFEQASLRSEKVSSNHSLYGLYKTLDLPGLADAALQKKRKAETDREDYLMELPLVLRAMANYIEVIQPADEAVAALKNEQGEVIEVFLPMTITDNGLVQLKGMSNLQRLNLINATSITDAGMVHLKNLTSLKLLRLSGTAVTDEGLVHLKGLQLESLYIPQGAQTDLGLKYYLAALKTPTALHLSDWRVTDAGMVHLKNLTSLQLLSLSGTAVTDGGLVHLKQLTSLKRLDLIGCKITDEGLVHLKQLTNLQKLILYRTNITDAGVADLQMALPNCEILH